MNATRHFIAVVALVLGRAVAAEPPAEGWQLISNAAFSFSVPKAFKKTEARGIDSFVEEYAADGIKLSFDYGIYSNNFGDWPKETTYVEIKLDGESARIGTAPHSFRHPDCSFSTQVHIKETKEHATLSMFAACRTEKEVELAKMIFQTIRFARKLGKDN